MDSNDVSRFFPTEACLRATVNSIRTTHVTKSKEKVKSTKDLVLSDDMNTISLNGQKYAFLQYDNESKNKNRILIYFSQEAGKILKIISELALDGTFKYSPKIFYQIFTLIAIYKSQALPVVFFLLENKNYNTYIEALEKLVNILYIKYKIPLKINLVMSDFELAMQQAIRQAFGSEDHVVEIKGCWFHFCQAILRKVNEIGLKISYQNSYQFRFWIKRFMALALIPIDKLKDGINIIKREKDGSKPQHDFTMILLIQTVNTFLT